MRQHMANKDAFATLSAPLLTKDGLLPCSAIRLALNNEGYELTFALAEEISIFPEPECDRVTSCLVDYPELWKHACLRVDCVPSIFGSAPLFGVPFKQAVEIALKQGYIKAQYYLPETERDGRHATLLVQVDQITDSHGKWLQLQVWQYTPGSTYAHYIHALSTDFQSQLHHLDGATIQFSDAELDVLLYESRKVKGRVYQKHFRIDGPIEIEQMHALASAFLPSEELYDEAFRTEILQADGRYVRMQT